MEDARTRDRAASGPSQGRSAVWGHAERLAHRTRRRGSGAARPDTGTSSGYAVRESRAATEGHPSARTETKLMCQTCHASGMLAAPLEEISQSTANGWQGVQCAGARQPTRGRGVGLLRRCSRPSSNQNTKGDTKKDVVERKAEAHVYGNTHVDGKLRLLAIGQVDPQTQSTIAVVHHHDDAAVADPTASWRAVPRGRRVGYVSPHRCRSPPNRFARPGTQEWS